MARHRNGSFVSDLEDETLNYSQAVAEVERKKKSYDLSKQVVKNMEKMIELAQPNMKAKVDSVVLKYQSVVLDFPE